jgi:hypothetical protein
VLGRHVPQFEFLDVLFGNEPVLDPKERLYQRLLAADPYEATDQAEEILEEDYLITFYQEIGIPALMLAERDRARGVMADLQRQQIAASALTLVTNLEAIAHEEADEDDPVPLTEESTTSDAEEAGRYPELPNGAGKSVLCIGGRGELDDAAAAMLAQVLAVQGATVSRASFVDIQPATIQSLDLASAQTVVIGFLNTDSQKHARFLIRRFKRTRPSTRVGVVFWLDTDENDGKTELAEKIGADFVAQNFVEAVRGALSNDPVAPYQNTRRLVRRKPTTASKATP